MPEPADDRSPALLTAADVARHCRVSLRTVRRWLASGELKSILLGGVRRIHPSALRAFLRHGRQQ